MIRTRNQTSRLLLSVFSVQAKQFSLDSNGITSFTYTDVPGSENGDKIKLIFSFGPVETTATATVVE